MKTSSLALLALVLASPATAQSIGESYVLAQQTFIPHSASNVVAGLDGEWLSLSMLANATNDIPDASQIDGYISQFCGHDPMRGYALEQTSQSGFSMTRVGRGDTSFVQSFDWALGTQYRVSFDTAALFDLFSLPEGDADAAERRAQTLARQTGFAEIFRPGDDLLVISRAGQSEIFGRCS